MELKGKTVLITGAAYGIGEAFAKSFCVRGARVILVDIAGEKLKDVFDKLPDNTQEHLMYIKDLTVAEERVSLFEDLQSNNIEVEVLVNNAGIGYRGYVNDVDWETLDKVINLNVKATAHLVWLFLPQMKKRNSGGIINLASTGSFCGADVASVYTGTKAFVTNFTEGLDMELFDSGVRALAAHPGATDTHFWDASGWVNSDYNKSIKMMSAEDTAEEFINAFLNGKALIIAGARNRRMVFLSKFVPRNLLKKMAVKKYE